MSKEKNQPAFKRWKQPISEGVTVIPNRLITNKNLPPTAKLVLIYLLHNSEDWKVYQHKIREDLDVGICSLRTAISQLEKLGYLRRRQTKEKGKFAHYEYEYHSEPIFVNSSQVPVHSVHKSKKKGSPANGLPHAVGASLPMSNLTSSSKKKIDNVTPAVAVSTLQSKAKESSKTKKTLDITKRYRLSDQQVEAFNLLQEARLNTDLATLCFYAKSFSLERINAALIEMRGKKPTNPGAYFRKLLMKNLNEEKSNVMMNAEFAQQYKEAVNWKELIITKTHVEAPGFKLALKSPVDVFIEILSNNMPSP